MAGLRPGHPRLSCVSPAKTWMPGTRTGMTNFEDAHGRPRASHSNLTQLRRIEPVRQRQAAVDHDRGSRDIGRYPVRQHRERHRCEILATAEAAERNVFRKRWIGDETAGGDGA